MRALFVVSHSEDAPLVNPPKIIAKSLRKEGHQVTVLSVEDVRAKGRFANFVLGLTSRCRQLDGIEYCSSPFVKLPLGIEYLSSTFFAILFSILHYRRREFDVIFSGDCGHVGMVASIVGRIHRCPVIADFADPYWWHLKDPFVWSIAYRIDGLLERMNLRRGTISRVFVNDMPIADHVSKEYPGTKVTLCPLGYYPEETAEREARDLDRTRSVWRLPKGRIVLYAGSLGTKLFRSDVLLGAARMIIRKGPDAIFVLSGRVYDARTSREIRLLEMEEGRFRFLGWLPKQEYRDLLRSSYVCVSTRDSDIVTSKVIEYMNAGKPVVLSDLGWRRRDGLVVGGYNCIRVSLDSETLASAVLDLLADEGETRRIAQNGKQTFAPYTWDMIAAMHADAAEEEIAAGLILAKESGQGTEASSTLGQRSIN